MREMYFVVKSCDCQDADVCGSYKHIESPDFQILLIGCSVDREPPRIYDIAHGDKLPLRIKEALYDPSVIKYGWDGSYERICLSRALNLNEHVYLPPQGWRSLRVWARESGYPSDLRRFFKRLNCNVDCLGAPLRCSDRFWFSDLSIDKPDVLRSLNRDAFHFSVRAELEALLIAQSVLETQTAADTHWEAYATEQTVNDRGILLDMQLIDKAIAYSQHYQALCIQRFRAFTGIEDYSDFDAFREWLHRNNALDAESTIPAHRNASGRVDEALNLWHSLVGDPANRYFRLRKIACSDGRVRGLYDYGGGRCGRTRNALFRTDNLRVSRRPKVERIRSLLLQGNSPALDAIPELLSDMLSDVLIAAFIPPQKKSLLVLERPSLNNAILEWLSGRSSFGVFTDPQEKTPPAIRCQTLKAHLDSKVRACIQRKSIAWVCGILLDCSNAPDLLEVTLPSGRVMRYMTPSFKKCDEKYIPVCRVYDSANFVRERRLDGTHLVNDIVQGITQDLLTDTLSRLDKNGFEVVMHFQHSIVVEADENAPLLPALCLLSEMPSWARGLRQDFCGHACRNYLCGAHQALR